MADRMSASLTVRISTLFCSAMSTVIAPASRLPASPSASVGSTVMGTMAPAGHGRAHGGRGLRLDPDHPDVRPGEAEADAGHQPAAAHRHDHRAQVRHLLEQLPGDRALAGDDVGVVVGRDVAAAVGGRQVEGVRLGLAVALAVENQAHVELLEGGHLGRRGQAGHDHGDRAPSSAAA
jgi:hypothetical protein